METARLDASLSGNFVLLDFILVSILCSLSFSVLVVSLLINPTDLAILKLSFCSSCGSLVKYCSPKGGV